MVNIIDVVRMIASGQGGQQVIQTANGQQIIVQVMSPSEDLVITL